MSMLGAIIRMFLGWMTLFIVVTCPIWIPIGVYMLGGSETVYWPALCAFSIIFGVAVDVGIFSVLIQLDAARIKVNTLTPPLKEISRQLTEGSRGEDRDWR